MDWTQYAVGGAAARPDSFTGLKPEFAQGVYGLTRAAHEAGIPLQITSAYRSPQVQADLVYNGMPKYGLTALDQQAWASDVRTMGPEAAGRKWRSKLRAAGLTRWIAMPGGSDHQRGTAVDFAVNGQLIRDANSQAAQFIAENASNYGLNVPMDWEPWQVGYEGGSPATVASDMPQGGDIASEAMDTIFGDVQGPNMPQPAPAGRTGPRSTFSARGPEPMDEYQPEKASGILGMLFPNMTADRQDRIVTGLSGLSMFPNQAVVQGAQQRMSGRREDRRAFEQKRQEQAQMNRTREFVLRQVQNGNLPPVFAEMAQADPVGAFQAATQRLTAGPEDNRTALMQNVEYIMQQNPEIPFDQALQMARSGTTINNNMGNSEFGTIPPGYELFTDEQGNRRMRPIAGGPVAREIELQRRDDDALGAARSTQQDAKETTITRDVDRLVAMIDQGGLFNLPEAGIVGGALGGLGVNQEAVDFKNTLAGIQSAVAFDRLQQMREASKTGGALGAVSERELDLLMSAHGALQQNTSGPMLKENLLTIKRIMTKIENDPVASRLYYGSSNQSNAASNGFSVTGRID